MADIEVVGVYKREVTDDVFQPQLPMYGAAVTTSAWEAMMYERGD